ncbi:MAG: DUF302 domain-containing protein [Candidatus Riflebacteria bacterium]|nr:DUF302 domain-containing protein [Candidatus Riflebacteria bacterium]
MLLVVSSSKPLDRLCADLETAVARHTFGVLSVHDLKQTLAKKGVEFTRECRIFEVCNPHQAKRVLEADIRISTALPCRISVWEEGGQTRMATIRPTALIGMFDEPGLKPVAEDVESIIHEIMKEAAL